MKRFPLELQVALENVEFWASMEVRRGDDPAVTLATFNELAEHVSSLAEPAIQRLVRHRLRSIRRLVELKCGSPPVRYGSDGGWEATHARVTWSSGASRHDWAHGHPSSHRERADVARRLKGFRWS